ncbi:hypothetical protein TRIUR3_22188 [Triticum urartu]|uniref:Uncharacterized protein n=1 Tax=Triticum urartu TaxID=4572 RepID=M7YRC6_TRIUA|nr:hypothetical protein TRIUR3_22188 [Triticum urartu]
MACISGAVLSGQPRRALPQADRPHLPPLPPCLLRRRRSRRQLDGEDQPGSAPGRDLGVRGGIRVRMRVPDDGPRQRGSSLVALCLKQIVRTFPHYRRASSAAAGAAVSWTVKINRAALRVGILACAVGSVCGCGFLTMALVNVVQVKLGRLGCGAGGSAAWGAVIPLVTLVPSAMLIYIGIVFYAFTR